MASAVKVTTSLEFVKEKLKFDPTETLTVDAFDKCDLRIAVGEKKTVDLQPSERERIVMLYVFRTDAKPDATAIPPDKRVWYWFNDDGPPAPLDNWHFSVGNGVFNNWSEDPLAATVWNTTDNPVEVTFLIGRINEAPVSEPPNDEFKKIQEQVQATRNASQAQRQGQGQNQPGSGDKGASTGSSSSEQSSSSTSQSTGQHQASTSA